MESVSKKNVPTASIRVNSHEVCIEKIDTTSENLLISTRNETKLKTFLLEISQDELIDLLRQAIHAGVLTQDFIARFRQKIEI